MRLSVIVPVYNTENYLLRCLDSICVQDFKDMEIICIDDGSQDRSGEILEQYKERDSRIKVIHQDNMGVNAARKAGIRISTGEYVTFVDSDDWIEEETFSYVFSILDRTSVDLISSAYWMEFDGKVLYKDVFEEGVYSGEYWNKIRKNAFFDFELQRTGIYAPLCSKVIRRELMDKVLEAVPDSITMYEDKAYLVHLLLDANSIYISHRPFYHYVKNQNSAMNSKHDNYLLIINELYHFFQSLYVHPKCTEEIRKRLELYIVQVLVKGVNKYMGFSIPNLMWINPDWKKRLPYGSKIILYGAGAIGQIYYNQIIHDVQHKIEIIKWVDKNYNKYAGDGIKVECPESILSVYYDYVVVAIKNVDIAEEVVVYLKNILGVSEDKLVLFENQEIFWKYAEGMGYLQE